MADYVKDLEDIPKVIDLTDAISLNYERSEPYQMGLSSLINNLEQKRVLQYESEVMNHFDRGFLVSKYDRDFMSSFADVKKIDVIPNGVDIHFYSFRPNEHRSESIVFLGNLRTFPNTDATIYFVHSILPLIKKKIPEVQFIIVGQEPSRRVRKLIGQSDITVTNAVPDIRPYLTNSAVSVCPLRAGAGVQNKILESMAIGIPVVTTSIGLQGIEAKPEQELLVADEPHQFADNVVRLIKDRELSAKLSKNARKLIEEQYTWEKSLSSLDKVIETLEIK
jgi:glycosyltransferase involved in cell wall biosynthesis